jgi:hypothetical protein
MESISSLIDWVSTVTSNNVAEPTRIGGSSLHVHTRETRYAMATLHGANNTKEQGTDADNVFRQRMWSFPAKSGQKTPGRQDSNLSPAH